jgi:glutathione synthase
MRIGCVMDPIERVNIEADTTFAWILAAQELGHEVFYIKPGGLFADKNRAGCVAQALRVKAVAGDHYSLGEPQRMWLQDLDVCWMRKDPPFDAEYLYSTYVLELADQTGQCWVLNRPSGLRDANEKAFILHFPQAIPETLVTHDAAQIKDFVKQLGGVGILKPLDGHGGAEIFQLRSDDLNLNTIIETITREGRRYVMVQRYLPEARQGDKRILLVDGEPYGAILRVPRSDELRGNIHVGGTVIKTEVTARDRELIAMIAPELRRRGLYFVGLDVIGDYVTEINVTSPTGIQEMSRLDNQPYAQRWIKWIEENLGQHKRA